MAVSVGRALEEPAPRISGTAAAAAKTMAIAPRVTALRAGLDVAIAVARAAVVVGVLVTAVALRDPGGTAGRCGGRGRALGGCRAAGRGRLILILGSRRVRLR